MQKMDDKPSIQASTYKYYNEKMEELLLHLRPPVYCFYMQFCV